jgi:hypothetical protein
VHEDAAADNDAIRSMQSEQEYFTGAERSKGTTRWSPEVHLREVRLPPKVLKPFRVC